MRSDGTKRMITDGSFAIQDADQYHLGTKQHIFASVMSPVLKEPSLSGNLS